MPTTKSEPALPRIFTVRKVRVVMDADLAILYGVPTMRLNEAVKRNLEKFPVDFSFLITRDEFAHLISQTATSSSVANVPSKAKRLAGIGHGGRRKPPRVFTEHGAPAGGDRSAQRARH